MGWGPLARTQELETEGVRWMPVTSAVPLLVTETLRTLSPQLSSPMMGREARSMPDRAFFGYASSPSRAMLTSRVDEAWEVRVKTEPLSTVTSRGSCATVPSAVFSPPLGRRDR